jgi:chromosome segregation ATPase
MTVRFFTKTNQPEETKEVSQDRSSDFIDTFNKVELTVARLSKAVTGLANAVDKKEGVTPEYRANYQELAKQFAAAEQEIQELHDKLADITPSPSERGFTL